MRQSTNVLCPSHSSAQFCHDVISPLSWSAAFSPALWLWSTSLFWSYFSFRHIRCSLLGSFPRVFPVIFWLAEVCSLTAFSSRTPDNNAPWLLAVKEKVRFVLEGHAFLFPSVPLRCSSIIFWWLMVKKSEARLSSLSKNFFYFLKARNFTVIKSWR